MHSQCVSAQSVYKSVLTCSQSVLQGVAKSVLKVVSVPEGAVTKCSESVVAYPNPWDLARISGR